MRVKLASSEHYTIGWISALPIERAAATAMLDDRHDPPDGFEQHQADTNSYSWGRVGEHNVVIASLPAGVYGITSAATTASNLLSSLPHIRIGLLVGIGGAVARPHEAQDIRLGDVVVGKPTFSDGGVYQYDFGKAGVDQSWEARGRLNKPPQVLLHALASLQAEHEISASAIPDILEVMWNKHPQMRTRMARTVPGYFYVGREKDRLFASDYNHISGQVDCDHCDPSQEVQRYERETTHPHIHYGLIASGNTLVKDAQTRDKIIQLTQKEFLCFEMEAAGLVDDFPCIVIKGVSDYADSHKNDDWQRYASATAAAFAKELLSYVPETQLRTTPRALDVIQSIGGTLSRQMNSLRDSILNTNTRDTIGSLPYADGAAFDSESNRNNPTCLANTRVDFLDEISRWIDDPEAKLIFWLNGMAGTGKSTISRTVASSLSHDGRLGASFFFKRGEANRTNINNFFTTIARQLAVRRPSVAPYIAGAIEADSSLLLRTAGREQFTKLIIEPLSRWQEAGGEPQAFSLVIVIDALDECENDEDIKYVIRLFSQAQPAPPLRLKILITSRPELPIRLGFSKIGNTYTEAVLHNVPTSNIEHDLEVFINHELGLIREDYNDTVSVERHLPSHWPTITDVQVLVKMAVPLFIFAATACRFIGDRRIGNPEEQLAHILLFEMKSLDSQVDATYLPILDKLTSGLFPSQKDQVYQKFRDIVGPIVLLGNPLSVYQLSNLLCISATMIQNLLDSLHSVLHVPPDSNDPIKLHHLSFRDFLTNHEKYNTHPFWINESMTHDKLAIYCFRTIMRYLKQDIFNVGDPSTHLDNFNIDQQMECIPTELQYACIYWVQHVVESNRPLEDDGSVHQFLKTYFLYWVEALAIMGKASEITAWIKMTKPCLNPQKSHELSKFLEDAILFLQANISLIINYPLQLYSSCLVFAPMRSVRVSFENKIHCPWITGAPRLDDHWSECIQIFKQETSDGMVAVSPDSKLIAVAGRNDIRVWNIDTGQSVTLVDDNEALHGHCAGLRFSPYSIMFSKDSSLLFAAASNIFGNESDSGVRGGIQGDITFRVWRVNNGECIGSFRCKDEWPIYSASFLHAKQTSVIFARGSKSNCVQLWECAGIFDHSNSTDLARSPKLIRTLPIDGRDMELFLFSQDGSLVVTQQTYESAVQIWATNTGSHIRSLTTAYQPRSLRIVFSADMQNVASAMPNFIWIYNLYREASRLVVFDEGHEILRFCLSYNSALVATIGKDNTIRVYDANTSQCVQTLRGFDSSLVKVEFSPDSEYLLSFSADTFIRIWRVDTSGNSTTLVSGRERPNIKGFIFSPDFKYLATVMSDATLYIYDATSLTGSAILPIRGWDTKRVEYLPIQFSPLKSTLLAYGSQNTIIIYDIENKETSTLLQTHPQDVTCLAFSPDDPESPLLASGSTDGTIRIWAVDRKECLWMLGSSMMNLMTSIAFSSTSSQSVVVAGQGGAIYVLDIQNRTCQYSTRPGLQYSDISTLAFIPNSFDSNLSTEENENDSISRQEVTRPSFFGGSRSLSGMSTSESLVAIWRPRYLSIRHIQSDTCFQCYQTRSSILHLSFKSENGRRYLVTDNGIIRVRRSKEGAEPPHIGLSISKDGDWILWNQQRILRIPPNLQVEKVVVVGMTVGLACRFKPLRLLRFSPEELFKLTGLSGGMVPLGQEDDDGQDEAYHWPVAGW